MRPVVARVALASGGGKALLGVDLWTKAVGRHCGEVYGRLDHLAVFPATQYVVSKPTIELAIDNIRHELEEQVKLFESQNKMLEAHRLRQRTEYDLEMLGTIGTCPGVENYSRHLSGRQPGEPPPTLIDYLPHDALMIVDESHVTIPQLRPVLISMAVLDLIWTSQQFALIWMTTGGGPLNVTEMLSTYTYKQAFSDYEFSTASASAVIVLLLTMILAFFYVRRLQRER